MAKRTTAPANGRAIGGARLALLTVAALLLPAFSGQLASAAPAAELGSDPIESIYVAELREVAADVEAALADAKALNNASGALTWKRKSAIVNPLGAAPPDNVTISPSDGHLDWTVLTAPQADFDLSWDSPPATHPGGTDLVMNLTATGQITGGMDTQGFRSVSAIQLIAGRWTRAAVGASVNCFDPIGSEPISCSPSDANTGTFTFGFPSSGDTYVFSVSALNCGGWCAVEYTYVAQSKESAQQAAGQRLAAAIARAKAMLKTYQRADQRHGTSEEHQLVNQIMFKLAGAGGILGQVTATPVKTTPKRRGQAQKLLRQVKPLAAAAAAARWPGLDKVEELLKNPRSFNRLVKRKAISRFEDIIDRNKSKIVGKALRGVPIRIGVPLRTQVRWAAEDFLLNKLGTGLLSIGPGGLVMSFFGEQISVAVKDIALAARPTGNVERRVNLTLKGFANREAELERLGADVSSKLSKVRSAAFAADGAHRAAAHLRRDLKALVKRRCKKTPNSARCEGAQKSQARLISADKRLERAVNQTIKTFLLGREFDEAELRSQIKGLCALQKSVKRINAKLN